MPALPPEAVAHLARIARLPLTPAEEARFAAEAGAILGHFEAVQAALADPPPEAGGPLLAPRADEPVEPAGEQVAAIVGQFPRTEDRLGKVPEGR